MAKDGDYGRYDANQTAPAERFSRDTTCTPAQLQAGVNNVTYDDALRGRRYGTPDCHASAGDIAAAHERTDRQRGAANWNAARDHARALGLKAQEVIDNHLGRLSGAPAEGRQVNQTPSMSGVDWARERGEGDSEARAILARRRRPAGGQETDRDSPPPRHR